jgi:hypothetical protein
VLLVHLTGTLIPEFAVILLELVAQPAQDNGIPYKLPVAVLPIVLAKLV